MNFGTTQIFTTATTGSSPFTYSWNKNGSPVADGPTGTGAVISGSSTPTLTLSGVAFSDNGTYTMTVFNINNNSATTFWRTWS